MEVRLNKSTLGDLSHIFEIIYKDKPLIAEEYIAKLQAYISLLKENPEMGKECKYKNIKSDCRILYYGNYRIIYRVASSELIRILKINNTKQGK